MSQQTFGKKAVMEEYLASLLTEDTAQSEPLEKVSKLLDSASLVHQDVLIAKPPAEQRDVPEQELPEQELPEQELPEQDVAAQALSEEVCVSGNEEQLDSAPHEIDLPSHDEVLQQQEESAAVSPSLPQDTGIYTESFQALIFEVAGLSLALPLTELGGIHQLAEVTPIFGKPKWYKGIMLHRDEKIKVVDTAMWVMPEKCNEKLADSAKNQYLIMLDDSGWGLACESIIDTVTLQPSEVKWRKFDGKRTWLSGMVKKKMCALVNVKQLIRLLQQGMNSNDN